MKNLKKKLNKEGGFTLIEMLIVVAIIAILIAIAIPLVNQALERSREATDAANERSFKAVLMISYLNGIYEDNTSAAQEFNVGSSYTYYFDAANGVITTGTAPAGYGKSTALEGADDIVRRGGYLVATVDEDGSIDMYWDGDNVADPGTDGNLISPKLVGDVPTP